MRKFDLEEWLLNKPKVITMNGKEVLDLTLFPSSSEISLVGVIEGSIYPFSRGGEYFHILGESDNDLFFSEEEIKECPCCGNKAELMQSVAQGERIFAVACQELKTCGLRNNWEPNQEICISKWNKRMSTKYINPD